MRSERREIPDPPPADQDTLAAARRAAERLRSRPITSLAEAPFAALKLKGSLRPYQRIALEAFEADRAAGRRSTHLVAPPGSGKTVIGLEIVRRLERPALVLAPTATVAGQWRDKLALFTEDPAAYLAPDGPLHVFTYQAICQTNDPGGALREAATERLIAERAQVTGTPRERVWAEVAAFTGSAREHFERDVATAIARLKRAAARGEGPEAVRFEDLLARLRASASRSCSPPASARSCSTSAITWPRYGATWSGR